jgi:hypothetical protein
VKRNNQTLHRIGLGVFEVPPSRSALLVETKTDLGEEPLTLAIERFFLAVVWLAHAEKDPANAALARPTLEQQYKGIARV